MRDKRYISWEFSQDCRCGLSLHFGLRGASERASKCDLQCLSSDYQWLILPLTRLSKSVSAMRRESELSLGSVCTATSKSHFIRPIACYETQHASSLEFCAQTHHQRIHTPLRTYTVMVVPSNLSRAVYIALPPLPFCAWKSMCFPS